MEAKGSHWCDRTLDGHSLGMTGVFGSGSSCARRESLGFATDVSDPSRNRSVWSHTREQHESQS
jgi:hypothetical protein